MYRDWSGFELFFIESSRLEPTRWPDLARFETFLMTLFEKCRSADLQNVPAPENCRVENRRSRRPGCEGF